MLDDVAVMQRLDRRADREDVLSRLSVHDRDGKRLRDLPLPVFGNVSGLAYDLDTDTLYASSPRTPRPPVYALAGQALDWKLVWQDDPPLDLRLVAKRIYVPAKDGAKIPVFIVAPQGPEARRQQPDAALTATAASTSRVEPFYLGSWSSFINRGGIFVDAGIRGGNEYGERWHGQAMFARKQNTFDDFIAVAEWLMAEKYTQPAKLAIQAAATAG